MGIFRDTKNDHRHDHVITVNRKEETVVRLRWDQLDALRKDLGGATSTFVTKETTEIQAGFMLGVNHVLAKLQAGYTIETP
jgi:hypothetical protein